MAKVSYDMAALDDGEVRIVHENGRVLELAADCAAGEWFCYENGSDDGDCYAQGFYEHEDGCDVMQDEEGNELARIDSEDMDGLLKWAETMLA